MSEPVEPTPDNEQAIAFLKKWQAPWLLIAVDPERKAKLQGQTFHPGQYKEMLAWLTYWNGKRNLYFSVNPPRRDLITKADKSEVLCVCAFHVDIDPREGLDHVAERERILKALQAYSPPPSIIIDSGGGYQGFWLLEQIVELESDADIAGMEAYNRKLEKDLGGDHCFNVDRIMRLPGTVNLPDAKKKKKGRVKALASLISAEWSMPYKLEQFNQWKEPEKPKVDKEAVKRPKREPVEWTRRVIEHGPDHEGPRHYGGDRSKAVYAVCCSLVRSGWSDDEIVAVLTDKRNGISEHVRDQSNPPQYARRQAARARDKVGSEFAENDKGAIITNQPNIRLALAKLEVTLTYDEFARRPMVEGPEGEPLRTLNDDDITRLYLMVDEVFGFRPKVEYFWDVVLNEARAASFHPVRNYLDSLKWDGEKRLDTWLTEYGGAPDSDYTRAIASIILIAAVRRIRQPGCKFDEMLILESPQGLNKSSALAVLARKEDWFSDSLPLDADDKEIIEVLSGKWIVEAPEMKGLRGQKVEHLKAMLSRRVDRARLSYQRTTSEVPRQCVIIATTNSKNYLRDITGNRRFWPTKVERFRLPELRQDCDQLWAEAAQREANGESIRLSPDLYDAAMAQQEERLIGDPWVGTLEQALGPYEHGRILSADVWTILNIPPGMQSQDHNGRMGDAMREMGWERVKYSLAGKTRWHYAKGTSNQRYVRIIVSRDSFGRLELSLSTDLDRDHVRTIDSVNSSDAMPKAHGDDEFGIPS
jgi:hypothetical protein